jgi:hypothetical protein
MKASQHLVPAGIGLVGAARMVISTMGGNYTPQTVVIDAYKIGAMPK